MDWRWGSAVILAVAVLALAAVPAAAAPIQKTTDAHGTIRISNLPAKEIAPLPAAASADLSSPPEPAKPQAAAPEEPASPLRKVSYTPPEPQSPEVPQAQAASGGGPDGSIRRYRDAQGVLHISNADPAAAPPGSRVLAGEPTTPQAGDAPVPVLKNSPPPGLKNAAWSPEDQGLPGPRTQGASPGLPPGAIQRYRDRRGVLHISNVAPETREAAPPVTLAAQQPPGSKSADRPKGEGNLKIPWKPASWGGELALSRAPPTGASEAALSRAPPAGASEPQALPFSLATIRRYRDEKGVWHILSVAPAGPENLALMASAAVPGSGRPAELAASKPGSPGPAASPAGEQVRPRGPPPTAQAGSPLLAYRDAQGRLHISNPAPGDRDRRGAPLLPAALEAVILEAAQSHRLPPPLVAALIKVESNFVCWAVSPKGAMGLMQLMPDTATFLGVTDPFCPRQNIWAGCRYLRLLLDTFGDCLPLALAAYNAGFQRVINAGFRVPAIPETQEFVTRVLERYFTAAYGLNPARPQGVARARAAPPFT